MKKILISDTTLKETAKRNDMQLSFKEKIELAKLMDKLHVSVIEMAPIENEKIDSLLIKSIASSVNNSIIAVPAGLTKESVQVAWEAIKNAKKQRLQVIAPMSTVQMEFICHKKPDKLLETMDEIIAECKKVCADVEFVADDATRSDKDFLCAAIERAIRAGATTVTVCDTAGNMLPDEFEAFIREIMAAVPAMAEISVGAGCSDAMSMASACAIAAVKAGVSEVKTAYDCSTMPTVSEIIRSRGDSLGVSTDVAVTEMQRIAKQVAWLMSAKKGKSPFDAGTGVEEENMTEMQLSVHDTAEAVAAAVKTLGYDLSDEDQGKVYESFKQVAAVNKTVNSKELDAIIASVALQVPSTYHLDSYVLNTGNIITSTATITITKGDVQMQGISGGDGPVDAAFLAIEQVVGQHFELDDFQISSVTEGRKAMATAVVKLRHNGKLYPGKGVSTNIIGASIRAYMSALNKIVYEAEEA